MEEFFETPIVEGTEEPRTNAFTSEASQDGELGLTVDQMLDLWTVYAE